MPFYVNMQKIYLSHNYIYPGLVGWGFLSYPGIFFIIVAVVAMSAFIINNLSRVSNFKVSILIHACLTRLIILYCII